MGLVALNLRALECKGGTFTENTAHACYRSFSGTFLVSIITTGGNVPLAATLSGIAATITLVDAIYTKVFMKHIMSFVEKYSVFEFFRSCFFVNKLIVVVTIANELIFSNLNIGSINSVGIFILLIESALLYFDPFYSEEAYRPYILF